MLRVGAAQPQIRQVVGYAPLHFASLVLRRGAVPFVGVDERIT